VHRLILSLIEKKASMILINFSHPLIPTQLRCVEQQTGKSVERVIDIEVQFDSTKSFLKQVKALIDTIELSAQEWQTLSLLINLPGLSIIAAPLIAELHGRMGYFPTVLRLRPIADVSPLQFEVAEILDLQAVRDEARVKR
jgi:hypothetical protein